MASPLCCSQPAKRAPRAPFDGENLGEPGPRVECPTQCSQRRGRARRHATGASSALTGKVSIMSVHEKNLEISFEQDMPIFAVGGEECVIPTPAFSRRNLLLGWTALGATLLLGRMAEAESFAAAAQAGAPLGKTQSLTARTFSSPRHTTRYWEAGPADGPLMIFLHGWPEIGLIWRAQVEALRVRRLALRCTRHARLRWLIGANCFSAYASAVKEIVEDMVELHDHLGARLQQSLFQGFCIGHQDLLQPTNDGVLWILHAVFIVRLPVRCPHGRNPTTSITTSRNSSVPGFTVA